MILVFHLSDRTPDAQRADAMFGFKEDHDTTCATLFVMGLYDCVALVDTDDADLAWQLTNTIDQPWVDNAGVRPSVAVQQAGGCRSSCVGDILVHGSGEVLLTASIGFDEIGPVVDQLLVSNGRSLVEPGQVALDRQLLERFTCSPAALLRLDALGYKEVVQ